MNPDEVEGYVHRQIGMSEEAWAQLRVSIGTGAKLARIYFDSLIAEGFTANEALRLVTSHGVLPKYPNQPRREHED